MYKKQRKIGLFVGKTGYGKSYLVKSFVYSIKRCIIIDPNREYENTAFEYLTDKEQFDEWYLENHNKPIMRAVLGFDDLDKYLDAIDTISIGGNVTLVIEEISIFTSAKSCYPELRRIIRFGRHKDISLIGITQRFGDLDLLLRNNLDFLVCFQLSAPNDIKYLKDISYIGNEADKVSKLRRYESILFKNFD